MKSEFKLIDYTNKKRVFKGHVRHRSIVCIVCGKRKRNLLFHFKTYHSHYYNSTIALAKKALAQGEMGTINGFRFLKSSNF